MDPSSIAPADVETALAEEPPPHGVTYRELQRIVFLVFGLLAIWYLAGPLTTLILFFVLVFILTAVLNPLAVRLQRRGIPRLASALGIALCVLLLVGGLGAVALPGLLAELAEFAGHFPERQDRLFVYYQELLQRHPELRGAMPSQEGLVRMLTPRLQDLLGQVGRYTLNAVGAVVSFFVLLVLVIFSVANPAPLVAGLLAATPDRYRPRVVRALRRVLHQLKQWALGSLLLGCIIGAMTAVGLWGLGRVTGHPFPYILLFSLIAGIGEMIPTIGPIASAVPPALIAFTIDPMLGVWVIVLFLVIQQLENNLIVPLVMGHSLDFHPVSIIFGVLVMASLFGLFGAVLAMPVAAIVKVCWQEFYLIPRKTDTEALAALAEDIILEEATEPSGERSDPGQKESEEEAAAADEDEDEV